jgi:hypothetical protein
MAKDKSTKAAEPEVTKGKKAKGAPAPETKAPKGGKDKAGKPAKGKGGLMAPGSGGQFKAEDHLDHLLLITPKSVEEDIVTSNGTADATRADVVDLTTGKAIKDALIFQKVVQGQLREAVEAKGRVVGTLFIDNAAKKAGQNAPYKLAAPSSKDIAKAQAYLDKLDPLR